MLPLLAEIKQPVPAMGLGLGVHPGALEEFQHEKPPFIQTHADSVALVLALLALMGLWILALKVTIQHRQKLRVDKYIHRAVALIGEIEASTNDRALGPVRRELLTILMQAIGDMQRDEIDQNNFQAVHTIWQIASDMLRERRATFRSRPVASSSAAAPARAQAAAAPEEKPWSFAKYLK